MSDLYTVDTPEQIAVEFDVAGIGSRFLAALIDTVLQWILVLALIIGTAFVGALTNIGEQAGNLLAALAVAVGFILWWGYFILFEMLWNGQSPGKRLIGLRVVREGGRPVGLAASAIRNLVRTVDFLPALYGIGVVAMFVDPRARRLGDLAAGTLVVREQREVTLASLTAGQPPAPTTTGHEGLAPSLMNLELLETQDYELVREYLRRRAELSPEARARLSYQLAAGLSTRMGVPPPTNPQLFLETVAREYPLMRG